MFVVVVCVFVCVRWGGGGRGGIPLYKQQFYSGSINLTISFSISNRSCETSEPAVQLLLSMSIAFRNFHDVNSVVTD